MAPAIPHDELINDASNDNPVAGLKGTLSLKERFKFRLSRMLGSTVAVTEADDQTLHIYIGPKTSSKSSIMTGDDKIGKLVEELQEALRKLAWCSAEDPQKEEIAQDVWDLILVHVSPDIHNAITKLQATFRNHARKYEAVVTQLFGIDDVDEFGSSIDTELGDLMVELQQLANSYNGTVKQQNELVKFACDLLQRPAVDVRLKCILGSVFSNDTYDVICALNQPLRTHHTLVRTASSFLVFRTVSIHIGAPPPPVRKAISRPPRAFTPTQQPQSLQLYKPASPRRTPAPPQRHLTPPKGSMMDTIRNYLPEKDHGLHLFALQPPSKQATAVLIGCLLHNVPVPPGSDTYYIFGFSTCLNGKHVRELAAYHRRLLDTSLSPTVVFQGIVKALEHRTLPELLRNKGRHNLDKTFPVLTGFLTTQPEKRFSVHRLIRFIRDEDNDKPLPCLRRDYGFKFCTQREHVTKLKALYGKVIDKAGPGKLHYACTFGRLLDYAIGALGFVDPSMRRLLQNDYPNPAVGYDNLQSLEKYTMPLFKRTLRG
ncbi:hypothetical protein E8E11_010133 [Didymella keratinophila]|nr:hypothetical protein E8E11_010133 [Didymella keratinophila]